MEAELDYFTHWWNTHHMRKTHTASCPGGVPVDIFALPQLTGMFVILCLRVDLSLFTLFMYLGSEDYLYAVDPQLYDETSNYSHLFNLHFTAGNLRKLHSHC